MDLTKRQQEIFDFIKRYSARHGYPPTVRDIGKAVGLASSSTVHQHLANLERIGLLRRDRIQRGDLRSLNRKPPVAPDVGPCIRLLAVEDDADERVVFVLGDVDRAYRQILGLEAT